MTTVPATCPTCGRDALPPVPTVHPADNGASGRSLRRRDDGTWELIPT